MIRIYFQKFCMKLYSVFTQKPCIYILKKWGLKYGKKFNVQHHSSIDISHCWHIEIGNNVTLAPYAQILAHDASTYGFIGYTKIGNVIIGNNVFIGAGAIILPGCKIGNDVIIGAGSIVTKDLESGYVYAGNPAKKVCSILEYTSKINIIPKNMRYDENYHYDKISRKTKEEMKKNIGNSIGLIK